MVVPKRDRIQEAGRSSPAMCLMYYGSLNCPYLRDETMGTYATFGELALKMHGLGWQFFISPVYPNRLKVSLNVATAVALEAQKQSLAGRPLGNMAEIRSGFET